MMAGGDDDAATVPEQGGELAAAAIAAATAADDVTAGGDIARREAATRRRWAAEQKLLRGRRVSEPLDLTGARAVAGADISFVKGSDEACASLVVCALPDLQVVYADFERVRMTEPYISGFLAFREVHFLTRLFERFERCRAVGQLGLDQRPLPEVRAMLLDGNGVLHPEGFGLACHLGVLLDLPTVGVAKNFLHVDGLTKDVVRERFAQHLASCGHDGFASVLLEGASGRVWGAAVRSAPGLTKPIYVSEGHRTDLDSCLALVELCSRYRVPEPIRQADLRSREWLREHPSPAEEQHNQVP